MIIFLEYLTNCWEKFLNDNCKILEQEIIFSQFMTTQRLSSSNDYNRKVSGKIACFRSPNSHAVESTVSIRYCLRCRYGRGVAILIFLWISKPSYRTVCGHADSTGVMEVKSFSTFPQNLISYKLIKLSLLSSKFNAVYIHVCIQPSVSDFCHDVSGHDYTCPHMSSEKVPLPPIFIPKCVFPSVPPINYLSPEPLTHHLEILST